MSFPQFSDLVLVPCLTLHLPCPILHCITLPHSPTIFTCYAMPGDTYPQIAPSEPHSIYT